MVAYSAHQVGRWGTASICNGVRAVKVIALTASMMTAV